MYDEEDVGDVADVDITNMGPNELAKLHKQKRAFRDSVIDLFLAMKQSYPSPAKAFGSAIDASELTASCNVLDQEISNAERALLSSAITTSDSESINIIAMPVDGDSELRQLSMQNRKRSASLTSLELSPTKKIPRNNDTAKSTFTIFNPYLKWSSTSA